MAKVKVSQATIDKIKAMGMTKALKGASNASPEMREALTRMYGARRVSAAGGSSKPAAKSADAARSAAMKPKATGGGKYVGSRFVANTPATKKPSASGVVYKSADAARAAATKKPATKSSPKYIFGATNLPSTPSTRANSKVVTLPKKTGTTDPFAKFVFGLAKGVTSGQGAQKMTAAQVAAENKRRAALAKKNK